VLEIVDNDAAYDTLATQIAAGNAPDIVGPVGIRGRDSFKGAWLDLQPMLDKNNYDLSDFDPALVEFYQVKKKANWVSRLPSSHPSSSTMQTCSTKLACLTRPLNTASPMLMKMVSKKNGTWTPCAKLP
jgi:hypothetical protein